MNLNELHKILEAIYEDMPSYMPGVDALGESIDKLSDAIALNEKFEPAEYLRAERDRQLCDWKEGERI